MKGVITGLVVLAAAGTVQAADCTKQHEAAQIELYNYAGKATTGIAIGPYQVFVFNSDPEYQVNRIMAFKTANGTISTAILHSKVQVPNSYPTYIFTTITELDTFALPARGAYYDDKTNKFCDWR